MPTTADTPKASSTDSGVTTVCSPCPFVEPGIGIPAIDREGRYLRVDFENLSVISLYEPSGSSGEERQRIKFSFMRRFFPHLKRRSDEAQAATLEHGKENAKRWLKVLSDHWIGPNKAYLCGADITIADHFGACIVTIGEVIGIDFSAYPNIQRWLDNVKKLPTWPKVNEAFNGLVASTKGQTFVTLG